MSLCTLNTIAAPFSSWSGTPQLRLTYRTQRCNDQRLGSLDARIFAAKLSRVEN